MNCVYFIFRKRRFDFSGTSNPLIQTVNSLSIFIKRANASAVKEFQELGEDESGNVEFKIMQHLHQSRHIEEFQHSMHTLFNALLFLAQVSLQTSWIGPVNLYSPESLLRSYEPESVNWKKARTTTSQIGGSTVIRILTQLTQLLHNFCIWEKEFRMHPQYKASGTAVWENLSGNVHFSGPLLKACLMFASLDCQPLSSHLSSMFLSASVDALIEPVTIVTRWCCQGKSDLIEQLLTILTNYYTKSPSGVKLVQLFVERGGVESIIEGLTLISAQYSSTEHTFQPLPYVLNTFRVASKDKLQNLGQHGRYSRISI